MLALLRFLFFLGLLGGAGYGILYVLAEVVDPPNQEIIIPIPSEKFKSQ